MQRARTGHSKQGEDAINGQQPAGPRASARVPDRAAAEVDDADLESSASSCAPPGSRASASSSSAASSPIRTRISGPGKLEECKSALKAADANLVAVDDELSPRQERNLEQALGVP